jgi:predicted Fe-S protein YdhL (DUF1289 family)
VIATPCIKVCVMDQMRGHCTGCGRTLDEIARWGSMTDGERETIMRALPDRAASGAHHDSENGGLKARGPGETIAT